MKLNLKIILLLIVLLSNLNCFAANDFTHTLDLAKHSSCSYIAEKFDALSRFDGFGNFVLKELKKKDEGLFPWRFEVTNGYQEGFFYFVLLGYANELSGDIPFAYRCYQNSLACIDEDKSFDHPLPRVEIYLAIGRTCLAAGRYMDAKDWLDNAFLESGDNLQLQAAIDRVLIQRANEIGDYPEVIFLYQHLENLANQKTPRLDKEGCPKGGVVERTTGHGLRVTDYANYAQILFYSRKDREGFSKLLTGISKLGIDNNLGVKDPLVDKFLNNIMRADDNEVKWFYDLLGWAIVDARAKAGDENYLAFLCNARTLFCKVYDFLNRKDDLKKVKERIDVVKEQLAEGVDVFGEKMKKPRHSRGATRNRKIVKSSNRKIINGEMEKTPGIILEDLLMLADWKLKQRNNQLAETNYYLAYQIATGTYANLEYDGTTMENTAIIGIIQTGLKIKPKLQISNFKFQVDNSYRASETTLQLYIATTNDIQRAEFHMETAIKILPQANLMVIKYFKNEAQIQTKKYAFLDAIQNYKEYFKRKGFLLDEDAILFSAIYAALGEREKAFAINLKGLSKPQNNHSAALLLGKQCLKTSGWAQNEDLRNFPQSLAACLIMPVLNGKIRAAETFKKTIKWKTHEGVEITALREAIQKKNINYLTNSTKIILQSAHRMQVANVFLSVGLTNEAFSFYLKSMRHREGCAGLIANDALCFPCYESRKLNSLVGDVSEQEASKYLMWLQVKMGKLISGSHRNAKIMTKELNAIIMENALLTNYIIPEINLK